MTARMIDGAAIAADIRKEIKVQIDEFGRSPRLAIISIGEDEASKIYIKKKIEACKEVGISASNYLFEIPKKSDIQDVCANPHNDAVILQLPLPTGFNPIDFFSCLDPMKDVDVFHPENVGLLIQGRPRFKPCTPHGIQQILYRSGIKVAGKNVVIINRSNVVGKPLSSMLIQECDDYANATVTVCHDHTPPELLKDITRSADIVIVAVGKPKFLTVDMVKPGVGVVDVGITRIGNKIVGDVDPRVYEVAEWATPVPGGCGVCTVACLLENVFLAAKRLMR